MRKTLKPESNLTLKPKTEIVPANIEIDYAAMIKQMVDARVAEIMADKAAEDFRPFFEVSEVAIQIRRRQTVTERKKWVVYNQRWGCVLCGTHDRPMHSIGMCHRCHSRIQLRLAPIRRELMTQTESPEIGFRDGVEYARQALMPSIEKLARKKRKQDRPALPADTSENT